MAAFFFGRQDFLQPRNKGMRIQELPCIVSSFSRDSSPGQKLSKRPKQLQRIRDGLNLASESMEKLLEKQRQSGEKSRVVGGG